MNDNYGEESCSDQEDLVGASASELDDDVTDMDEIQFSFCKATGTSSNHQNSSNASHNEQNMTPSSHHLNHKQENCIRNSAGEGGYENYIDNQKSKFALFGSGFGLLLTSLMMLVILPLYLKQLALGGESYNAYGAIIYIGLMIGIILGVLAAIFGRTSKWNIKFYKCPLEPKK